MRMNPGGALGMGGKFIFSNFIEVTYLERIKYGRRPIGQSQQPTILFLISFATVGCIRRCSMFQYIIPVCVLDLSFFC